MFVCVYGRGTCLWVCIHKGQKSALDPLELELEGFVSCAVWLLGTKLESSQGQYMLSVYHSILISSVLIFLAYT